MILTFHSALASYGDPFFLLDAQKKKSIYISQPLFAFLSLSFVYGAIYIPYAVVFNLQLFVCFHNLPVYHTQLLPKP